MKLILLCSLALNAAVPGMFAQSTHFASSTTVDATNNIRCSLQLVTNRNSHCASAVSITLENLAIQEPFSIEVATNIVNTFMVSVFRGWEERRKAAAAESLSAAVEQARLSKRRKSYVHDAEPDYVTVIIPPKISKSWTVQFADVIDPKFVTGEVLTNCVVHVTTVVRHAPPASKLLSLYVTNVCIYVP